MQERSLARKSCVRDRLRPAAGRLAQLLCALIFGLGLLVVHGAPVKADDTPTFQIEFHDGKIAPLKLEVPANRRFRIELHNTGVTAAEFQSSDLHLEKVLAPNNPQPAPVLVIRSLDPGQYIFFDDLHADAPKILLIAK